MACGAPEMHAKSLMSHDKTGHCFFRRQPENEDETYSSMVAMWASCCGAVRYGGQNKETLIRLAEMGLAEQCDIRLPREPGMLARNHVLFEFEDTVATDDQEIIESVTQVLSNSLNDYGQQKIEYSNSGAVLEYEWAVDKNVYRVIFVLQKDQQNNWLLRIMRSDMPPVSFCLGTHEEFYCDKRFKNVRWFTEEEWTADKAAGRDRPY